MPFSLTNSPVAFQRFMNNILRDLLDHCIVIYLDDILVYSDDPVQHREHIQEILKQLRQNSLFTKVNKCEWHKNLVEFLGYILKTEGLTMAEDKVKIIRKWPEPRVGESAIIRLKTATAADQKAWGHAIDFVFLF